MNNRYSKLDEERSHYSEEKTVYTLNTVNDDMVPLLAFLYTEDVVDTDQELNKMPQTFIQNYGQCSTKSITCTTGCGDSEITYCMPLKIADLPLY
jgi:hypothetical protein